MCPPGRDPAPGTPWQPCASRLTRCQPTDSHREVKDLWGASPPRGSHTTFPRWLQDRGPGTTTGRARSAPRLQQGLRAASGARPRSHSAGDTAGASAPAACPGLSARKHPRLRSTIPGTSAESGRPHVPHGTCQSPLLPAAAQPWRGAEHQNIFPCCSLEVPDVRGKTRSHGRPKPSSQPTAAPRATGEQPLPHRVLAFPVTNQHLRSRFPNKTHPTSVCSRVKPYLPAREAAGRENPLGTAKFTSAHLPSHEISPWVETQHGDLPDKPPRIQEPAPGGSSAPWGSSPRLSASSPAAAPCLPWGFGLLPPFLHAPYPGRAHPAAAPSCRLFAEGLQVVRQRSRELIFLLIKGRKISLFLNRVKTTEGRAQKLFLSWRRDHRLESKALSRHT